MGESKRRKDALGDQYGQSPNILPGVPITKNQADRFVKLTTQGAWVGIGLLATYWIMIRFIGPAFGWWQVN